MRQDEFRTERARELRREMTPTEKRLWSHLRGRRFAGFKFRRQTPVAGYIADFYCAQACLIIELDGESHIGKEARDENRQQMLETKGVQSPPHLRYRYLRTPGSGFGVDLAGVRGTKH